MQVNGKPLEAFLNDARINNWIWLKLRSEGVHLLSASFGDLDFRKNILVSIDKERLDWMIKYQSTDRLLSKENIRWIKEDERQVAWLWSYINRELAINIYPLPEKLHGRDLIIAAMDMLDVDLDQKLNVSEKMRYAWNDHLKNSDFLKWFGEGDEASRCATAWKWMVEKHERFTVGHNPISNYQDLLIFFDRLPCGVVEKKDHARQIRNRWNQRNNRAVKEKNGVVQFNIDISKKSLKKLNELAAEYDVSRGKILEVLIEYEKNIRMYLPMKKRENSWD